MLESLEFLTAEEVLTLLALEKEAKVKENPNLPLLQEEDQQRVKVEQKLVPENLPRAKTTASPASII